MINKNFENLIMRKYFLLLWIPFFGFSQSQEWMTSMSVAQRLALTQDKMILMMWEEDTQYPYPMLLKDGDGNQTVINLFEETAVNEMLWENFILVKVSETFYAELRKNIVVERSMKYMNKFNDDSIKVMDANGNILNVTAVTGEQTIEDLSLFIEKYALKTTFLKEQLKNYYLKQNFTNTFNLAKKYIDFAILVNSNVKKEVINLSSVYLEEAESVLLNEDKTLETKTAFLQRIELLEIKQHLILKKPRKAIRHLKKVEGIDVINKSLYASLFYAAYLMKGDEKEALTWKIEVSLVDLKKANLIIKKSIK